MTEEKKEEVKEEEVKPEKTEEDEFDEAFDDATSTDGSDEDADDTDHSEPKETKDAPAEGTTQDDPLSQVDDGQNQSVPQKTQREVELEEELERQKHKMSTWEGRISAANERAKKAEEEAQKLREAKESKSKDNLPDGDEEKAIKEFIEEFPDLHKPIVALVKRELLPLIGQLIDDRVGKIEPQVTSIKQKMETDTTAAHFAAISRAHKDWRSIVDSGALDKWINTKTSYIKGALLKVKAEGDTQEVIDMLNQYKKETGQVSDEKNNPAPAPKDDKAQSLLAVPSSPTTPSTQNRKRDKNDFDAGWEDALREK